jgi:biopolymer transport protein ExbB/TolQ
MIDKLLNFLQDSTPITIVVLSVLLFYFIVINWVFFYRYFYLTSWNAKEEHSLESLLLGTSTILPTSYLYHFIKGKETIPQEVINIANASAVNEATKGLTFLSIVASTSPFIGLFGTVISILETFSHIGASKIGTISIIAEGVGEALIATGVGIFVAIFAYSYHQIVKQKAFLLTQSIRMQGDALISRGSNNV